MYCFYIKYDSLTQIPEKIFKKIKFYGSGSGW